MTKQVLSDLVLNEKKHTRDDQIYLCQSVNFSLPVSFTQPLKLFGY